MKKQFTIEYFNFRTVVLIVKCGAGDYRYLIKIVDDWHLDCCSSFIFYGGFNSRKIRSAGEWIYKRRYNYSVDVTSQMYWKSMHKIWEGIIIDDMCWITRRY